MTAPKPWEMAAAGGEEPHEVTARCPKCRQIVTVLGGHAGRITHINWGRDIKPTHGWTRRPLKVKP
jgi:hypothetical protein